MPIVMSAWDIHTGADASAPSPYPSMTMKEFQAHLAGVLDAGLHTVVRDSYVRVLAS